MDLLNNLVLGLNTALSLNNLFFCFVGVVVGTLVGVLPGIGPTATIALLLPTTFALKPETSLIMLAGIYYGSQYGGSTTAILMNLPGETSSAVTAIDGYQMGRQGRAGPALAAAALGSFFAGTVATFVICIFAPPLIEIALQFGPPEYFALMLLGLIASVALAHGSVLKALAMIVLGLLLGLVGSDVYTGTPRYTFGLFDLNDGISLVAVAVGVFGVTEILRNLESEKGDAGTLQKVTSLIPTRDDMRRMAMPIVRGTAIGSLLGVLPGGGAILASFAAYAVEKKISKTPERFGHGAIEGVASPESANNAGAQTSFIPMLTLGIPANPAMAMMIGAMIIQGIVPGPNVANQQPELFWGIIASMWVGNVMLVLLNLPLIGIWVRLLSIPYNVLFPAIIVFAAIGVFSVENKAFDLFMMSGLGLLGYVLVKHDCEPVPLLLGFVLGPLLEEHLRRGMLISHGDPMIFLQRPISAGLLAASALVLIVVALPAIARKRETVFVEEG
jgi:putative tricarboxylic transport membrane protein